MVSKCQSNVLIIFNLFQLNHDDDDVVDNDAVKYFKYNMYNNVYNKVNMKPSVAILMKYNANNSLWKYFKSTVN